MRKLPSWPRIIQAAAAALLFGFLIFAVVMFGATLRMSREIVSEPWRHPVEIVSALRGNDSEPIARLYGNDWRATEPVDIDDLPDYVPRAFVAAEDVRFYHHPGIDPIGLLRATLVNLRHMRLLQGGSTITQQLIKQKVLSNQRTFRRKIPEMLLAVVLTARMSKKDVLEGYLNDVYLGDYGGAPVLGIDEASQMYFDKPPNRLTVDQAALLAASIRAPNRVNPIARPAAAKARRDVILATMHDHNWITDGQYQSAVARRIHLNPGQLPDAPFGHYLSALRTELATAKAQVPASGIRVICEVDPRTQKTAEESARRAVSTLRNRYGWLRKRDDLQVAILSADPQSGGVRALVGSRDFASDAFDRTRRMLRQPGSALKPFVYAAALGSRKFTNVSILLDEPLQIPLDRNRTWSPQDYDERFRGPVTLRVALEQSLNVPTVRLAQQVGLRNVADELDDFGFSEDFEQVPSMPLGVTDVTLRELVSAYSVFPALGEQAPLHLVREVRDERGRTIYKFDEKKRKVCDPPLAWLIHDLLRGVVLRGTASRLLDYGLDHVAGKTGTTSDYRDAWFIGYAPDLITGLWLGSDSGAPLRLSAAEAAIPAWASYMSALPISTAEIPPPSGVVFIDIDPASGGLWLPGCRGPVKEAFLEGTKPAEDCRGAAVRTPPLTALLRGNPEPPSIDEQRTREWIKELTENNQRPIVIIHPHGRILEIAFEDDKHKWKRWKHHKPKKWKD